MTESARLHSAADRARLANGPTAASLTAFGVEPADLRQLAGGQGNAYSDGRLVLKSVGNVAEHNWVCDVFAGWTAHDEVRVPEPVKPPPHPSGASDNWSVDGWGAHVLVPGRDTDPVAEIELIRQASDVFHQQLAGLARPAFIDQRDDPWAYGDRVAWGEAVAVGDEALLELVEEIHIHLRPVESPAQVIHGDILPNVLFADGLAPAVIDWPPYYRPAAFANAIAVTDALTFRNAPTHLLDTWETGPDWDQLLLRAILYRLGPTGFFTVRNSLMGSLLTHVQRVRPVVHTLITRVST